MQEQEQNVGTGNQRTTIGTTARQVASLAQDKAGEQVRSGIDAGKTRAASALHGVAESLLNGSADQQDGLGQYIRQAGERVQRAADFLDTTDARELSRRTEEYARRQPAIFLGGAFALGLIAARFFKSSHRRDGDAQESDGLRRPRHRGTTADFQSRHDRERSIDAYHEPTIADTGFASGGMQP